MTLIAAIPFILILVGLLMYALCANPKLQEVGRITFAAGIFSVAFAYAGKLVTLFGSGPH